MFTLNDWKKNIAQLDKSLNDKDLTLFVAIIESLKEELTESIRAIQADPINTTIPTQNGTRINGILDILKETLNDKNDDAPPFVSEAKAILVDKKVASLTWKGDARFSHYMVSYQFEGGGEVLFKTENTKVDLSALKENSFYNIRVTGVMQDYTSTDFTQLNTRATDPPKIQITESDLELTGKFKVAWNAEQDYPKYLFKYTDSKGFIRYVETTKNSVSFSEFDFNENYTYTVTGILKDNTKSEEVPGSFMVKNECPFLSEITIDNKPEKIIFGERYTLRVSQSANLSCLTQLVWYNKNEVQIGTGRNITIDMNEATKTISVKCSQMRGSAGEILNDCHVSRQFQFITSGCEVSYITASKTNIFEGEQISLTLVKGCLRGTESYWLQNGKIIGKGDKIFIKPELNSTDSYYVVCQDGSFSCATKAPTITVRPLCEKMELTFPRFTDKYLLVQAVNCPKVSQWNWSNTSVKKASWKKKDGFPKEYLGEFTQENAILLELNRVANLTITASCLQAPCSTSKAFVNSGTCANENCATIPVVTYLGNDFYEVRLVQSLDNEKDFHNYTDWEKIRKSSLNWDWLSGNIADNLAERLLAEREKSVCNYQIPTFKWPQLNNSTKPNQIIQAKDLPQIYNIEKKLNRQNGFLPPDFSGPITPNPAPLIPRYEVSENCTQQLEVLIPAKGSNSSGKVNFELKTISLPNGEEYIFPVGCQNEWEEGLVFIDLPDVPGLYGDPNAPPLIPAVENRQIRLLNSEVVPIQMQIKPWQIRVTCMLSGSTIPLTYSSEASNSQKFKTAALWTYSLIAIAYGLKNPTANPDIPRLPLFEDLVNDLTIRGVYVEGLLPALYNFIRNNYNSTWVDYDLLNGANDIKTSIGPEQYRTINVVKRVVNELCKDLSNGTFSKAQKKEILCKLQENIKAANPNIKTATDAEIEAFANGDCSKIIKLWNNDNPITKETAEGILAKNKELLTSTGQSDCSQNNERLIVSSEIREEPTCGGQKGRVYITASGGTGTYQYKLSTSLGWQPEGLFRDLEPGTYVFEARDSDGNKGTATVKLEIKQENGLEEVEASTYYNPPVIAISGARIGSEPSITVQWDKLHKVYTFTPKAGVIITKLSNGRIKLSTTNPEDQKWEGEYGVYFKANNHNEFVGFYNRDISGPCTSSKYTEDCKPLCQERWLPEEVFDREKYKRLIITIRTFLPYNYVNDPLNGQYIIPPSFPGIPTYIYNIDVIDLANVRDYPQYKNVGSHGSYKTQQTFEVDFENNKWIYKSSEPNYKVPPTALLNRITNVPSLLQNNENSQEGTNFISSKEINGVRVMKFNAMVTAGNPAFDPSPNIDYNLTFEVKENGNYRIDGFWDGFPAIEIFIEEPRNGKVDLAFYKGTADARQTPKPMDIFNLFPLFGDFNVHILDDFGNKPHTDRVIPYPDVQEMENLFKTIFEN